jgi:plastocyanin
MMDHSKLPWRGAIAALAVAFFALPAHAQDPAKAGAVPSMADFTRLQNEVREQRALIIQMMQNEQQRYDMLLKLIQSGGGSGAMIMPPSDAGAVAPDKAGGAAAGKARATAAAPEAARRSFIEGKVSTTAGDLGEVYVYVENLKTAPIRGKSIEIRQENKQFIPRLAVVQAGTSVVFPNFDTVYHNVFSSSPRNSFDLGSYRAGDKPRTVTLTTPGVVEIFCNMHAKMTADVLVVPNNLFTRVKPDGSFRLENVPVGARKLVAWSPNAKPAQAKVEVGASGAQATFVLEHEGPKAHTNKLGQAYGSYRE